jgi:hypothetical protein
MFKLARLIFHIEENSYSQAMLVHAIQALATKIPGLNTHGPIPIFDSLNEMLTLVHMYLEPRDSNGMKSSSTPRIQKTSLDRLPRSMDLKPALKPNHSPIYDSMSGEMRVVIQCPFCNQKETESEIFVSLNFTLMDAPEVQKVRDYFKSEAFSEGLLFKEAKNARSWNPFKNLKKKTQEPILTLRDYLCYLNLVKSFGIE